MAWMLLGTVETAIWSEAEEAAAQYLLRRAKLDAVTAPTTREVLRGLGWSLRADVVRGAHGRLDTERGIVHVDTTGTEEEVTRTLGHEGGHLAEWFARWSYSEPRADRLRAALHVQRRWIVEAVQGVNWNPVGLLALYPEASLVEVLARAAWYGDGFAAVYSQRTRRLAMDADGLEIDVPILGEWDLVADVFALGVPCQSLRNGVWGHPVETDQGVMVVCLAPETPPVAMAR